jgi:hypothetical protein
MLRAKELCSETPTLRIGIEDIHVFRVHIYKQKAKHPLDKPCTGVIYERSNPVPATAISPIPFLLVLQSSLKI